MVRHHKLNATPVELKCHRFAKLNAYFVHACKTSVSTRVTSFIKLLLPATRHQNQPRSSTKRQRVVLLKMEEETSEEGKVEKQISVGNSRRGWILRVGKKIVITGMVISSAPFVLPPVLLVSTIGLAFSVPFGLVFAGYACTEKVMSKLLSRPRVEMIEEGEQGRDMDREEEEFEKDVKKTLEMRIELIGDENETGEVEAGEEDQLGVGMGRGSKEGMTTMDRMIKGDAVEEGDTLVGYEKGVVESEDGNEGIVVKEPVGEIDDKQMEEFKEDVKKQPETWAVGVEEENQLGSVMARGSEEAIEGKNEVIDGKGFKEAYNVEGEDKYVEDVKGVIEEERGNEGIVIEEPEEEKSVREDNGLMRDEWEMPVEDTPESIEEKGEEVEPAKATERAEQEYIGEEIVDKPMDEEDMKEEKPVKQNNEVIEADDEVEIPVEETIANLEEENKLGREAEGGEAKTKNDYVLDKSIKEEELPLEVTELPSVERENEVNDSIPVQEENPLEGTMEGVEVNEYIDNRVLDEKLKSSEMEGMVEARMDDKEVAEKEEPLVETKEMAEERRIGGSLDIMVEEEKPKDNSRKIADEIGLDLFEQQYIPGFDETNEYKASPSVEPSYSSEPVEVYSKPQHASSKLSSTTAEHSSDLMGEETAESMVHPVLSERVESPANLASEMDTTIPSEEALCSEKEIWELMDAMRKIVGYKGDIQPNLMEELKALYIFTGVEPPVEYKDPVDIVELNHKLRLLMAIIGVK